MRKKMKLLAGAAAAVLLLSFGATTAFASDSWQGRYYVDADGDGVCDHAGSACQFVDADGDGICDRCGVGGWFTGWVDADGDGVCDDGGARQCGGSGCQGGHHACGQGRHCR